MGEDGLQETVRLLERSESDLKAWLRDTGRNEDDAHKLFVQILNENGLAAEMILSRARDYIPIPEGVEITKEGLLVALDAIRSNRVPDLLRGMPECSHRDLSSLNESIGNAMADFREDISAFAKAGPQHRHGGRRNAIDPNLYPQIRERIKAIRDSRSNLSVIFEELAKEYKVSPTTIKRIWQENPKIRPPKRSR